jgi:type II secretory pathway pseudopilin PulG
MQFRQTKGFSLLEVLVAILFLSITLLALLPALTGSVLLGKQNGRVNLAAQLAQQHMELVRGQFVAFVLGGTYQETQAYYQNTVPTQNGTANLGNFTLTNGSYVLPSQDVVYYYDKDIDSFVRGAAPANAGTQSYVVRTLVQADGPVAPCIGATCNGYNPVAGGNPLLFKKVTVAVYAATAANAIPAAANSFGNNINNVPNTNPFNLDATALANERMKRLQIGNPQANGVRTSEASAANTQTSSGPLVVISTIF